jgi:hypothetical protein
MDQSENEIFWESRESVSDRLDALLREDKPFVRLEAPARVDASRHEDIPVLVAQAGTARDFASGSLLADGWLALVDLDRNRLALRPVLFSPGAEPTAPDEPVDADLDDPAVGMQEIWVDLRRRFDEEFLLGARRFVLRAFQDGISTESHRMDVGPSVEEFDQAWARDRDQVPPRRSVPDSLLEPIQAWKAMSVTAQLPRGVESAATFREDGSHLEIAIACEELWGERIELEPGAVMANGMRPPDALRAIHLVLAGGGRVLSGTVEVPAISGFQDGLVRCRVDIRLAAVFPSIAPGSKWACYVFCGPLAAGPFQVDLPL